MIFRLQERDLETLARGGDRRDDATRGTAIHDDVKRPALGARALDVVRVKGSEQKENDGNGRTRHGGRYLTGWMARF